MNNICLIPARGGSKRIPNKNIKSFHGKPLIAWSIECALSSKLFKDVYVSTDSPEIASISESFGAKIPFMRPKEISTDKTPDLEVRVHFINWLKDSNIQANYLCYLYPTAPFITVDTLQGCYEKLKNSNADSILTVTNYPYPVQRALQKNEDESLSFVWEKHSNSRSQNLTELFHDAGQCYFFNLKKNYDQAYGKRIGYKLPRIICQDIDDLEDFDIAKILFSIIKNKI